MVFRGLVTILLAIAVCGPVAAASPTPASQTSATSAPSPRPSGKKVAGAKNACKKAKNSKKCVPKLVAVPPTFEDETVNSHP